MKRSHGLTADAPYGVVRAYDVRSGAFRWGWNAVAPDQQMHDSEGNFRGGTANVWSIISVDVDRGLVIVPTGNPYPDYYGGDRDGLDHYSSSVVALDGRSGEVVWSFQTVHHDIWDFDVPAQPTSVDLNIDGEVVPAASRWSRPWESLAPNRRGVLFLPLTFRLERSNGLSPWEVSAGAGRCR